MEKKRPPKLQVNTTPVEQTTNELKEKFNISLGSKKGGGAQGNIYEIQNSSDYVVKIVNSRSGAVSDNVRNRISVMGGGITKPLDSYKLSSGEVVEIYKKREKDCSKLNFSELENNHSIVSVMAQIFPTVETLCDNGVILNDLKPDNMLISKNGEKVTISDLGSTITVEETEDSLLHIMENEKFSSFDPKKTVKSPVYSLGAMTLEFFIDKDFNIFLEEECKLNRNGTFEDSEPITNERITQIS